ncbi:MAG: histidine phosphatase family protein [Bacillota bacterium]|jgi:broad specificity phosphatase PhoE
MTLVFAVGRRIEDGETMGTYFIVRHGETLANRSGILQGHLNVPLSDHGRKQADLVGKALSKSKIHAVYSSDLDRARETAMAIARHHNCRLVLDRRLREIHCGYMQGKTMDESHNLYPEFFEAFGQDPLNAVRPGGGESVNDLYQRTTRALEDIIRNYPESNVVIVTHGGVVRCLLAYADGIQVDPGSPTPANTSISVISKRGDNLQVDIFNDTAHLAPLGDDLEPDYDAYRWQ